MSHFSLCLHLICILSDLISFFSVLNGSSEALEKKHTALKLDQDIHIKTVKESLDEVETKTKRLFNSAEKFAPKAQWHDRLQKNDLPVDIRGLESALKVSTAKVKEIEAKRMNWNRRDEIDSLSKNIEKLFNYENDETKKRKADELENEEVVGDDAETDTDVINEGDNNKKKKKQKKKGGRQSSINNFFKKPA